MYVCYTCDMLVAGPQQEYVYIIEKRRLILIVGRDEG